MAFLCCPVNVAFWICLSQSHNLGPFSGLSFSLYGEARGDRLLSVGVGAFVIGLSQISSFFSRDQEVDFLILRNIFLLSRRFPFLHINISRSISWYQAIEFLISRNAKLIVKRRLLHFGLTYSLLEAFPKIVLIFRTSNVDFTILN